MISILITFGLGRFLYSIIERRDKWFVLLEILSIAIFIGIGIILPKLFEGAIGALLVIFLFVSTGFISRCMLPRHPIEAGGEIVNNRDSIVCLGIVDFGWISIMGAGLGIIVFLRGTELFGNILPPKGMQLEYYKSILDISNFMFGKIIDGILITGGILGGCMAILWAGEIWRKPDETARLLYKLSTVTAIKMVVAYLITALSMMYFLCVPLYTRMNDILRLLK